jgi:farnesyl-diphosphate farnesyltransferase
MDLEQVFQLWRRLPAAERGHVRDVVGTIVSGQRLDVQRAHQGDFPLQDEAELEDYCHRVAGCVGSFWTRIGMLTLGERFSKSDAAVLEEQGETFGRGLQLINILRDLAADLRQGRCYLPVKPTPKAILEEAARWRSVARDRMACGLEYAAAMRTRRLRLAVALPALLGLRTLDLLDGADWRSLEAGVKVSRAQVRRCALQAWFGGAELLSFGRTSAGGH